MSKPTVHIIYGFGEGDWNGIVFAHALKAAGYQITDDAESANIVIAHSAGCFYLPASSPDQLTVLIGPPYWPGRSMWICSSKKFWLDFRAYARDRMLKAWFHKTAHNSLYLLGELRKASWITRNARLHNLYELLRNKNVLIIRPEHDAFLTPRAKELLRGKATFRFFTVSGHQHDDCWRYPEPYIHLLQSEAKE